MLRKLFQMSRANISLRPISCPASRFRTSLIERGWQIAHSAAETAALEFWAVVGTKQPQSRLDEQLVEAFPRCWAFSNPGMRCLWQITGWHSEPVRDTFAYRAWTRHR
jgi:hypothetical protein